MSQSKAKATPQPGPLDAGAAAPQALSLSPLAGWSQMLEVGIAMTALSLQLLQAQRAALGLGRATPLAPAGARLTIGDIYQRVTAAGYREIREIEWDDGHYEVEASDTDGNAVELQVNGDSGAIEHVRLDD